MSMKMMYADEIWLEDVRGSGSSSLVAAFSKDPVEDIWKPFEVALGDANPAYRGGIPATLTMHFVGSIKGRLIFASGAVTAPANPERFKAGDVYRLTSVRPETVR